MLKSSYEIFLAKEALEDKPLYEVLQTHKITVVFSQKIDNSVLVPTYKIGSNPQIRLSEIKRQRFYIADRAQMKAREAIQKAEDIEILRFLE